MMNIIVDKFGRPLNLKEFEFVVTDDRIIDVARNLAWYTFQSFQSYYYFKQNNLKDTDFIQYYIDSVNNSNDDCAWRLPTINELSTLLAYAVSYSYKEKLLNSRHPFKTENTCWSSTMEHDGKSNTLRIWYVDFKHGNIKWCYNDEQHYVQLVMGI